MIKNKKIAYVSGTRADFGIMSSILKEINKSKKLSLQIYATGIHLMPKFGLTIQEVKKNFPQTKSIKATFNRDDYSGVAMFMGQFITKVVKTFSKNRPDLVLVLGDRPEELCVAMACLYLGIPTAHFRGGERTSTFDESARHAITKLCNLHFAATQESAKRIEKMGEDKKRIHVVGEASLDVILNEKLPNREELCKLLGLNTKQKFILLTQHPVSYEVKDAGKQIRETLNAVKCFNMPVIISYPHADAGGKKIIAEIEKERGNPLFIISPSFEYKKFLAIEREAAVWVGNSSGAMVESASFGTPVVNIGTRQNNRQRGKNVLDAGYDRDSIVSAIRSSLDPKHSNQLKNLKSPWGNGKTGKKVVKILENLKINSALLNKQISY